MNNDEKIVKEMIDTLVDTNVELWEVNLDLVSNLEIIDNIDDSDKCGYEGKIFEKYFYNRISYKEFIMFSYALPKLGIDIIRQCYQIKVRNNINELRSN